MEIRTIEKMGQIRINISDVSDYEKDLQLNICKF